MTRSLRITGSEPPSSTSRRAALAVVIALAGACAPPSPAEDTSARRGQAVAVDAAMPQLLVNGGGVVASPRFVAVTFAGGDDKAFSSFLTAFAASDTFKQMASEYGVGAASAAQIKVTDKVPKDFGDWLGKQIAGKVGDFSTATTSDIFIFSDPDGCPAGGYHSSVPVGGSDYLYAYINASSCSDGFDGQTWKASHEILEAVTDPLGRKGYALVDDAHLSWVWDGTFYRATENGDICHPNLMPDTIVAAPFGSGKIQRTWSNKAATAGQDPCVPPPVPARPYFVARPAVSDALVPLAIQDVDGTNATRSTRAVTVPKGGTVEVAVQIFSDDPQNLGTVTIEACVRSTNVWTNLGCQTDATWFTWKGDVHAGSAGDTLYLTVSDAFNGATDTPLVVLATDADGHHNPWYGVLHAGPAAPASGTGGSSGQGGSGGSGAGGQGTGGVSGCNGVICLGQCVDVSGDPGNCGSCGNVCAAGETCQGGACASTCPGSLSPCNGACVDLFADDYNNCGGCGLVCPSGQLCFAGTCGDCPAGTANCGLSTCVDLTTDQSCGSCGNACPSPQTCQAGTCQ